MSILTESRRLLAGTFADTARARRAIDELVDDTTLADEIDVAFYGAGGTALVLIGAKDPATATRAERILRSHGALIETEPGAVTRNEAADLLSAALENGLLDLREVLVLLVTTGVSQRPLQAEAAAHDAPRRGLREADEELRAVARRLRTRLRERQPDLFDRRGRLRADALTARLAERTGGKTMLSGDDLLALEPRPGRG